MLNLPLVIKTAGLFSYNVCLSSKLCLFSGYIGAGKRFFTVLLADYCARNNIKLARLFGTCIFDYKPAWDEFVESAKTADIVLLEEVDQYDVHAVLNALGNIPGLVLISGRNVNITAPDMGIYAVHWDSSGLYTE